MGICWINKDIIVTYGSNWVCFVFRPDLSGPIQLLNSDDMEVAPFDQHFARILKRLDFKITNKSAVFCAETAED